MTQHHIPKTTILNFNKEFQGQIWKHPQWSQIKMGTKGYKGCHTWIRTLRRKCEERKWQVVIVRLAWMKQKVRFDNNVEHVTRVVYTIQYTLRWLHFFTGHVAVRAQLICILLILKWASQHIIIKHHFIITWSLSFSVAYPFVIHCSMIQVTPRILLQKATRIHSKHKHTIPPWIRQTKVFCSFL